MGPGGSAMEAEIGCPAVYWKCLGLLGPTFALAALVDVDEGGIDGKEEAEEVEEEEEEAESSEDDDEEEVEAVSRSGCIIGGESAMKGKNVDDTDDAIPFELVVDSICSET